ncbi:MAG: NAD-dependent epimerase/dehydratase family protein [Pseudomonadota bacterium]
MKIFCTGASGYIGGSVAVALIKAGYDVAGLVRSDAAATQMRALGITPVLGDLDETDGLAEAARQADVVINTANADHKPSAYALLEALRGTAKTFIHTSGSSIVGTQSAGHRVDDVYDEDTRFTPSPARAERVALNDLVLSYASRDLRPIIICPSLIYGLGRGVKPHSMQVPWLIELAKAKGVAKHYGPGENIWSNVHIDDLVDLYVRALDAAPAGAFYYAENGENAMNEICRAISRMLGFNDASEAMDLDEAADAWGDGPARNTMGSNSRVRARRARSELGWQPSASSLIDEIESGCYGSLR